MIHLHQFGLWNDHRRGDGRLTLRVDLTDDGSGQLLIVAGPDPKVLLADELLHTLAHHHAQVHPGVQLQWQPSVPCPTERCCQQAGFLALRGNNCFYGALLTIDTTTERLVYVIGEYEAELHGWWAHWPD